MSKAFQVLQMGAETTKGTNVAADIIFRGPGGVMRDARDTVFKDENIAIVGGVDETYTPKVLAEIETAETEVSFEQFPHVLEASILSETPAQDGVGSGYIYDYALLDTTDPAESALKAYSMEYGDPGAQYEEASYCLCSEWEMKGVAEQAWKFTSKWFGREVANTTKTAGLSVPSVDYALFQTSKLYLDAVSGNFGTTQISATFLEATIKCVTGWKPLFTGDGEKYFTSAYFDSEAYSITVDLLLRLNASSVAQRDLWRLQTPRLMQIKSEGATLGTPGTTYSKKTMIHNYAGKWSMFESISSQNGMSIVRASFNNRYNATKADRGNIILVNELTALP